MNAGRDLVHGEMITVRPLAAMLWDCPLASARKMLAHALRELGLYWHAEKLERALLPVEMRPIVEEIRDVARDACAMIEKLGARGKHDAEFLREGTAILLQRLPRKAE